MGKQPGTIIRKARLATKLSGREFARRIGVSHTYLHSVETNKRPPSDRVVHGAVEFLGLERQALMGTIVVPRLRRLLSMLTDEERKQLGEELSRG